MKPTTIRLPADTLEALDSEYGEYGYGDRSEYIRAIIEHRDPPFETTATTNVADRPTTEDYQRLRDRVDELEARLDDLEGGSLVQSANQESTAPSPPAEPQGSTAEDDVVAWVREHQPVSRSDIVDAFEDYWTDRGIKGDSWWRRHARPTLEDAGFEFVRNVGWREE